MKENDLREFDECATAITRTMPSFLWNFYKALVNEGFTIEQSLELTKAYMMKI